MPAPAPHFTLRAPQGPEMVLEKVMVLPRTGCGCFVDEFVEVGGEVASERDCATNHHPEQEVEEEDVGEQDRVVLV